MKVQTIKNDPINSGDEDHSELKLRIMSTWLGWRDSNPRMLGPEPSALPLGDTPLARNRLYHLYATCSRASGLFGRFPLCGCNFIKPAHFE